MIELIDMEIVDVNLYKTNHSYSLMSYVMPFFTDSKHTMAEARQASATNTDDETCAKKARNFMKNTPARIEPIKGNINIA